MKNTDPAKKTVQDWLKTKVKVVCKHIGNIATQSEGVRMLQ